MATGDTFVELGTTFHLVSGKPATFDQSGYEALTFVKVGGVLSLPERGDTVSDVSEPTLEDGRVEHFNGARDGGSRTVPIKFIEADAGQALLVANAGSNTTFSFKETDSDGTAHYYIGRVGQVLRRESTPTSFKAYNASIMVNSATVTV